MRRLGEERPQPRRTATGSGRERALDTGRFARTRMAPSAAQRAYPRSTRRKDALHLVARQYSTANLRKPKAYWDDTLPSTSVTWGRQEDYEVLRQVGKGKYGEVYESHDLRNRSKCVIKIMRPVKEHRLRREIKILRHVRGGPNVVQLLEVLRDDETKTPCFVFEFVNAMGFRELQAAVTDLDVRLYIYQLLRALDFCHSRGIMHRDVKVRGNSRHRVRCFCAAWTGLGGVGWGAASLGGVGRGRGRRGAGALPPQRGSPPVTHVRARAAGQRADRPQPEAAQAHRLGPGGLLPPRQGVPRARGHALLQGEASHFPTVQQALPGSEGGPASRRVCLLSGDPSGDAGGESALLRLHRVQSCWWTFATTTTRWTCGAWAA